MTQHATMIERQGALAFLQEVFGYEAVILAGGMVSLTPQGYVRMARLILGADAMARAIDSVPKRTATARAVKDYMGEREDPEERKRIGIGT